MPTDIAGKSGQRLVSRPLEGAGWLRLADEVVGIATQLEVGILQRTSYACCSAIGSHAHSRTSSGTLPRPAHAAASVPAKICHARADLAVRLSAM